MQIRTLLQTKTRTRRILLIAGVGIATVLLTMLICTLITEHQVNQQLGFRYASPETPEGEPFLITRVTEGKAMQRAGLQEGDTIRFGRTSDLYRLLIYHQGESVTIPITRNGKDLEIHLMVPTLRLTVVRGSFLGSSCCP